MSRWKLRSSLLGGLVLRGVLFLLFPALACAQTPRSHAIDFDGSRVNTAGAGTFDPRQPGRNGALETPSRPYCMAFKGTFDQFRAGTTSRYSFDGHASLFVAFNASAKSDCKRHSPGTCLYSDYDDKAMFQLYGRNCSLAGSRGGGGDRYLELAQTRYFGLAFYVPPEFQSTGNPRDWTMLFQLWQGAPFGPPFAAAIMGNDRGSRLHFFVRNDHIGRGSSPPTDIGSVTFSRGQWTYIVMEVDADPLGRRDASSVSVWQVTPSQSGGWNAHPKIAQALTFHGPIGYDFNCYGKNPANARVDPIVCPSRALPDHFRPKGASPYPASGLQTMFGIYRDKQPTYQRVYFGLIQEGASLASVLPSAAK